jgi:predicted dehydrogenase
MTIQFAAVGMAHPHIHNQIAALTDVGAQLVWAWDGDPAVLAAFCAQYPTARAARGIAEILDDPDIALVVSALQPDERAALGIHVMGAGKDYSCAKPAFTSSEQLAAARAVQAETGRLYAIHFSERFDSRATQYAAQIVRAGGIGRVVNVIGMGPHRFLGQTPRPAWASDARRHGGILNDLASHQIDQFIHFTDSAHIEIVGAHVGNLAHPQFPHFQDVGDLHLRGDMGATGYIRVDWLTARGVPTWGDVRLFVAGTEGSIEIRKNVDLMGRAGGDHLFIADHDGARYIDCSSIQLTYGAALIHDVLQRTQTAMRQDRWFQVSELALAAQARARRLE